MDKMALHYHRCTECGVIFIPKANPNEPMSARMPENHPQLVELRAQRDMLLNALVEIRRCAALSSDGTDEMHPEFRLGWIIGRADEGIAKAEGLPQ